MALIHVGILIVFSIAIVALAIWSCKLENDYVARKVRTGEYQ